MVSSKTGFRTLLLLLVVSLVAVACGDGGDSGATTTSSGADATTSSVGEQTTMAPTSTTEAVDRPDTIKIGGLFTLSGAVVAPEALWGAEIAVDTINSSGGVDGIPLELIVKDHQCSPDKTRPAVQAALREGITSSLIGCSGPGLVAAPMAEEEQVLFMNVGGNALELAGASDYFFNALVLGDVTVNTALDYMATDLGAKTVATIYANDALGTSLSTALENFAPDHGLESVGSFAYEPDTQDFSAILSRVDEANPDVIYIATLGSATGLIIKQARERQLDADMVSYVGVYGDIADIAGDALEGVAWTSPALDLSSEEGQAYSAQYTSEHPDSDPGYIDVTAHDAILIIADALTKESETGGAFWEGSRIRQGILDTGTYDNLVGGTYKFNEDGTVVRPVQVYRWENGTGVVVKTYQPEDLG